MGPIKNDILEFITTVLALILWYCVIVFLTNTPNPLEWNIVAKIVMLLISISLINSHIVDKP